MTKASSSTPPSADDELDEADEDEAAPAPLAEPSSSRLPVTCDDVDVMAACDRDEDIVVSIVDALLAFVDGGSRAHDDDDDESDR